MKSITRLTLEACVLAVALAYALHIAPRAFANTCTWNGSVSNYWSDYHNWSGCQNGTPGPSDDVVIPQYTPPRLSSVDGNYAVNSLSLQGGALTVFSTASLSGGTLTSTGDGEIQNYNLVNMNVVVSSGTVSVTGNFIGSLDVAALATMRLFGTATFTGDVTIGGALTDNGTGQTFVFGGTNFLNQGTISAPYLSFDRSGPQVLAGSGTWTGSGTLRIASGSATSLSNDVTLDTNLTVDGNATLGLVNHSLTLSGTLALNTMCAGAGRVLGTGTFRTRGAVAVTNCGTFEPPVEIASGSATISGVYSGTLHVLSGATDKALSQTVLGDVVIGGMLAGANSGATFAFDGVSFTNDGVVTTPYVDFAGTGQTLSGAGYFDADTVQVLANASLGLGSDQRLSELSVLALGLLNLNGHTLSLTGGGAPLLASGTLNTAGSDIVYASTTTQTIAYLNVHYFGLTISNSVAAIAPAQTVRVAGYFTHTAGLMHGNGTFAFDGSAPQVLRGIPTTFASVLISNTAGVDLSMNASITGALTLNGDLRTGANLLAFSGTSSGAYDVFGNIRRGGFSNGSAYSFGSPYVSIAFTAGTPPSEIMLTLSKGAPSDLGFAVQRTYQITPTGGSGYQATLRLHYRNTELPAAGALPLQMWKYDEPLARWTVQPRTALDSTQDWLARAGVTGFSRWALAVGQSVFLPLVIR